ncbi:MAG TPA: ammonium transporter [Actinomycetota bacterium]|nr:ammonium transporter [Actinomycetota bacterium]
MRKRRILTVGALTAVFLIVTATAAFAQTADGPSEEKILLDTVWTLMAAFMVFLMQGGFAMVEAGFTRKKNAGNIVMKNLMDFGMSSIAFWAVGFALMFGTGNALIGTSGWFSSDPTAFSSLDWATPPLMAKWLFQVVFAGTAATIVSGAMAERTKFKAYLLYSGLISGLIYPIAGHWIWGGGWLASKEFLDFAGSTVVHSVGGWAALVGAIMVGPRLGKYAKDGRPRPMPGHSMPLGMLGVFLLWFGWFGFNPGSTMAATLSIADIAVTTNLAAAAGAIMAMTASWMLGRKPDVGMSANGALAGLVAITAGCAFVENWAALVIGAIAGVVVVGAIMFFDRVKVDDPVGAVSVHGVCGVLGTLMVGVFASPRLIDAAGVGSPGLVYGGGMAQLGVQALGAAAVMGWVLVASAVVFGLVKATVGLRVSAEEEMEGLDIGEHGMWGYPEEHLGSGTLVTPEALEAAREATRQRAHSPGMVPIPESS